MEASEGKSSCESMVDFPGVVHFTVDSIKFRAMKMLRWDWATFRLDTPLDGRFLSVTGVVNLLLIRTTAVAISIAC